MDILTNGHFAERKICRKDILPKGQFAELYPQTNTRNNMNVIYISRKILGAVRIILLVDSSEFSARCFIADTARWTAKRDGSGGCECSVGCCHTVSARVESLSEHSLRRSHLQEDLSPFFLSKT